MTTWRLTSSSSTDLLEVGRVDRPHGVRGEVVVTLITDRHERMSPGSTLTLPGGRVLVVASARPFRHRFIVRFEGVHTREDADALHGSILMAPPLDDPEVLWVHDLVGAEVVGLDGTRYGTVEALEANPASDLLALDDGSLVPLCFVVSFEEARVVIDPPAGLFELD